MCWLRGSAAYGPRGKPHPMVEVSKALRRNALHAVLFESVTVHANGLSGTSSAHLSCRCCFSCPAYQVWLPTASHFKPSGAIYSALMTRLLTEVNVVVVMDIVAGMRSSTRRSHRLIDSRISSRASWCDRAMTTSCMLSAARHWEFTPCHWRSGTPPCR